MGFVIKCLIFSATVALSYSRSLSSDRNIFELSQDINCSCDWRYFRHYETKGCFPETVDSCGCPQKFTCPINETRQAIAKVCVYQNKEYKVGSKIITSDICQVCKCRDGMPPYISCLTRECPEIEAASGKDCHLVYKENKCCPVGVECLDNEIEVTRNQTCEYDGKYYPFGSKIYPVDDPCQICICDENWNGVDNGSCYQQNCMFEKNKSKLNTGCIPVYHESRCCPIEFYCPSSHNLSYTVLSSNESADNYNISNEDQCFFAGEFYSVAEEVFINNPCVKCSCIVPPDLTCVHQSCSPSPSEENCDAIYTDGECCPFYECMLGDTETVADGCPTPLCADSSCRIETPPGHECPTCVCGERFSELEHNDLEQVQQVLTIDQFEPMQQVSQAIDQFEPMQQILESGGISDDSSEDELRMMPIRMQSTEGQGSVMERMILPDADRVDKYTEVFEDMQEMSLEDISSSEAVGSQSEENQVANEGNSSSLPELELNDAYNESVVNQSEKVLQKRSYVFDAANHHQTRVNPVQQEVQEGYEGIEREGDSEGSDGDFADELESFRNKIFDKNKTIINEMININHIVKVPPGCPTPMCEGPWCKIGIPPGHRCPTCICKRHEP